MHHLIKNPIPFLFLMMLPYTNIAQKATSNCIEWQVAAILPPQKNDAKALGVAGALIGVTNQVLLVGGGANFPEGMPWHGGKKKYHDLVYVFGATGKGMGFLKSCTLPFHTAYGASTSTPQGVVYAGGENEQGTSNRVLLVQWNDAAQTIVVNELPPLPLAVSNLSITSDEHTIYVAGGEITDRVSAQFLSLDLDQLSSGWKTLPQLPKPVSHAILVVQSSGNAKNIFLIGGRKKNQNGISDLYASVYAYDLEKQQWQEKKNLPYALSAGTGVATGLACILLFGGDKGETFHRTETLIAAINAEKDDVKKAALNQQKIGVQANHPGFSNELLQYNTSTNEWNRAGAIPFDVPVTTAAVMWGNGVIIPSGEVKAGIRTPEILIGRLNSTK